MAMFDSSLPPVVCRRAHVLFKLSVFVCVVVSNTYCVVLCCVLYYFVLCILCCQFLCVVLFDCPFGIL